MPSLGTPPLSSRPARRLAPHPRRLLHGHAPHSEPAQSLVPDLGPELLPADLLHVALKLLPELALPQALVGRVPAAPALARDKGGLDVERSEVLLPAVTAGAEVGIEEAEEDDGTADGDADGDRRVGD